MACDEFVAAVIENNLKIKSIRAGDTSIARDIEMGYGSCG